MNSRVFTARMAMVASLYMCGCVATDVVRLYPGDPRPSREVAIIQKQSDVVIVAWDDQLVEHRWVGQVWRHYDSEALPGPHTVTIEWRPGNTGVPGAPITVTQTTGRGTARFIAIAGHVYYLDVVTQSTKVGYVPGSTTEGTWSARITDKTKGEQVFPQ